MATTLAATIYKRISELLCGLQKGINMRKCKTSGATYTIGIANYTSGIVCMVNLPHLLNLTPAQKKQLNKKLHNALEDVLSDTFDFFSYERFDGPRSNHYMVIKK